MSGRSKTVEQKELYMLEKNNGALARTAAATAGVSERTGRRMEHDPDWRAAGQRSKRKYRTRGDPFEAVWETEIVPLLMTAPQLQAQTLLRNLQADHVGEYPDSLLRTLQRRVRLWRATDGPDKIVCFPQQTIPGQQALCDFTVMDDLEITIAGQSFPHRLNHVRLRWSGFAYAEVIVGGESFTALASGMRHALECFGGVPETMRTDSLSAAYKNLRKEDARVDAEQDITQAYDDFCTQYGMKPTRNNLGVSHENGAIESPHGHLKNSIDQLLLLRGNRDFKNLKTYQNWIHELIAQENARRHAKIAIEVEILRPLPKHGAAVFSTRTARVSGNATISVNSCHYTVPSRLKGMQLSIHVYDTQIQCYIGIDMVYATQRVRTGSDGTHTWSVNYHHVITSLRAKPGAFRQCAYREYLHPNDTFQQLWKDLDAQLNADTAVRRYIEILYLAFRYGESAVMTYMHEKQSVGQLPCDKELVTYLIQEGIHDLAEQTAAIATVDVAIQQHDLASYDQLLVCDLHENAVEVSA